MEIKIRNKVRPEYQRQRTKDNKRKCRQQIKNVQLLINYKNSNELRNLQIYKIMNVWKDIKPQKKRNSFLSSSQGYCNSRKGRKSQHYSYTFEDYTLFRLKHGKNCRARTNTTPAYRTGPISQPNHAEKNPADETFQGLGRGPNLNEGT